MRSARVGFEDRTCIDAGLAGALEDRGKVRDSLQSAPAKPPFTRGITLT